MVQKCTLPSRSCEQQKHDRTVHGEQLVVLLRRQELQTWPAEFPAHQQRHDAADDKKAKRRHEVHQPDLLGVRGPQQPRQGSAAHLPADRTGIRLPPGGGHHGRGA